jgi:CRP-like cAMP-binding protein
MALIDSTTRSASIVAAVDNTELYYLSTDDFVNLCKSNTAIGYIMMRNIAQDLSFKLRHNVMSNL